MKMQIVIDKIGHNSFTTHEIKQKEKDIMNIIQYNIGFPTILDFLDLFAEKFLSCNQKNMNNEHLKKFRRMQKLCLYVAKISRYEYKFLSYKYI
jgi:hypothetical protein